MTVGLIIHQLNFRRDPISLRFLRADQPSLTDHRSLAQVCDLDKLAAG